MLVRPAQTPSLALRSVVVALVLLAVQPPGALANGPELAPGGTRALGRGGASAARPTDPMAMLHNPAGLPRLAGDQVLLNVDIAVHNTCVQPYGYYGWGIYLQPGVQTQSEFGDPTSDQYSGRLLDRVCNEASVLPLPQLAWAFHVTDRLSFALGFVAPTLVAGQQWGDKSGVIATDDGLRPTPTRYEMIHQEVDFGLNPAASVAYRFADALSLGLTFHVGMAKASVYTMTTLNAGTQPDDDIYTKLTAEDFFIPGVTASVHSEPLPGLSLMASARVFDDFSGPGELTMTTNYYHAGAEGQEAQPHENRPVRLGNVFVGTPWSLTAAARYAQLLPGASDRVGKPGGDPLATERWDVEFDFTWNFNQRGAKNSVEVADDLQLTFRQADGAPRSPLVVPAKDIEALAVERRVQDSVALRLGGSYNPVPDIFGINAGVFYEDRGIDPSYVTIESFAFRRVGLGLGAVVRLGGFDLLASYSHIFSEDITVAPPPHANRDTATDDPTTGFDKRLYQDGQLSEGPVEDPRAPSPGDADGVASFAQGAAFETAQRRARAINAGRYTAAYDVVSVGVVYRY